jgi:hypothetical protein
MARTFSRRLFLRIGLLGAAEVGTSGCGTLLYPERIGQPPGPLDWRVVALDTIGLLLFLVPGVIAFAVDFYNGTIYLPPGSYGRTSGRKNEQLVAIPVPGKPLDRRQIEEVVSSHAGRKVQLTAGRYRSRSLPSLDEFWQVHDAMEHSVG